MTRRDTFTNTEADAARYDQASAYPDFQDERDEPGPTTVRGHACTEPDCRELLCVLDRVVAAQKADSAMFAKERAAVDAANRKEWDAE